MEELVGRQLRCQNLKQEEVGVDHGLAEVTLDVGHRLTFDLKAVADPKAAHNLVESSLKKKSIFTMAAQKLFLSTLNLKIKEMTKKVNSKYKI